MSLVFAAVDGVAVLYAQRTI